MARINALSVGMMMLILVYGAEANIPCPQSCNCENFATHCLLGQMTHIPIEDISNKTQTLVISASDEDNSNVLTIEPIFFQRQQFSYLEDLRMSLSNIESLGYRSFEGLHNLKILNVQYNKITHIVDDNFQGLSNLVALYLDHNEIEKINSEAFFHLSTLETLSLTYNKIKVLVPRVFRLLSNLTYLDLSYNTMEHFNKVVFSYIPQLVTLKCRKCNIKDFEIGLFNILEKIKYLDLGDNNIQTLRFDDLIILLNIEVLKLDGNQLHVFGDDHLYPHELQMQSVLRNRNKSISLLALGELLNLKTLDISRNKLEYVQNQTSMSIPTTLINLDLSENLLPIEGIQAILRSMPLLENVNLSDLSIDNLPQEFFTNNPRLMALNLSHNHLKIYPEKPLKNMQLKYLDLTDNELTILNNNALFDLEMVDFVNLNHNPWNCASCEMRSNVTWFMTSKHKLYDLLCDKSDFKINETLFSHKDAFIYCSKFGFQSASHVILTIIMWIFPFFFGFIIITVIVYKYFLIGVKRVMVYKVTGKYAFPKDANV